MRALNGEQAVKRRDEAEFEDFARARSQDLMRAAMVLTGEFASAEDLVQATLTRAYIKWAQVQAAGNPVAYVRTMQSRLFLDGVRKRSSREIPVAEIPDRRAHEEDVALREVLLAAVSELEPVERVIVVHRYLLDNDVASVAAELRMTPQAVRSRAARALAKVRAALGTDLLGTTSTTRTTTRESTS
jgi:RNA polymerase sigma factor (sigma-70 family)